MWKAEAFRYICGLGRSPVMLTLPGAAGQSLDLPPAEASPSALRS